MALTLVQQLEYFPRTSRLLSGSTHRCLKLYINQPGCDIAGVPRQYPASRDRAAYNLTDTFLTLLTLFLLPIICEELPVTTELHV